MEKEKVRNPFTVDKEIPKYFKKGLTISELRMARRALKEKLFDGFACGEDCNPIYKESDFNGV